MIVKRQLCVSYFQRVVGDSGMRMGKGCMHYVLICMVSFSELGSIWSQYSMVSSGL